MAKTDKKKLPALKKFQTLAIIWYYITTSAFSLANLKISEGAFDVYVFRTMVKSAPKHGIFSNGQKIASRLVFWNITFSPVCSLGHEISSKNHFNYS